MAFRLVIKHYETGARRFFQATSAGTRRISGIVFDRLVGDPLCQGVVSKEA